MNLALKYILQFVFLVFLQVFIFQKIYLTVYCIPFFYSMLILTFPVHLNKYFVLVLGFIIGWVFDGFYYTGGIHAAALTLVAYFRFYWLRIIEPVERYEENQIPVLATTNNNWFLKYIIPLVFIHHFALFLLEAFNLRYMTDIILRSILSTLVSVLIIYFSHLIFFRVRR